MVNYNENKHHTLFQYSEQIYTLMIILKWCFSVVTYSRDVWIFVVWFNGSFWKLENLTILFKLIS